MPGYGVPALAEISASASLTDTVFRRAAEEPGAVVLRRRAGAGSWQDVTAAAFGGEVAALAGGLVAVGIRPGDRIAVMSHTRYEWTLIDYAIWAAGAVTVPVYETSSAEQVGWILSAPLGERLGHFFRGAGITVLEGYGMTEATGAATMNRPRANKIGSVGQPLPGAAIQTADDGEIQIRGPNVFPGYWHNDAATLQALHPQVPDPRHGLHRGLRPAHAVAQDPQERGRQGLFHRNRGTLQPARLTSANRPFTWEDF